MLLVLATATASYAQDRGTEKVADAKFWIVGAALNTAMVLDTRSTFDVAKRCTDCYEANPIVAPFVHQGAPTTFIAGEAFDVAVMSVAAKMKASDRRWVHRTWWVVPVALIAGHTLAYRHNDSLAR
jgi:hypothetical protein